MPLAYYSPNGLLAHQGLPGMDMFILYFKIFGQFLMAPVDRSKTIKLPIQTRSFFPLPRMQVFTKTYSELCDERAKQLLERAQRLDVPLCAAWSGGIDSTCLLVSLLKNATRAQKEHIIVMMSEDSIDEYPVFYAKHIRGKLRRESAMLFPYLLGSKNLIVNGELNDQLFGSDVIAKAIVTFGSDVVRKHYSHDLFVEFFTGMTDGDRACAELYVELFERLRDNAPIPIKTNHEMFWWINFVMKWQSVYMRVLSFVTERNVHLITEEYVRTYYAPFYNTEGFQLWSMNNSVEQKVRNGWRSYKWPAKEVIFEYTKDADYRDNKMKRGSLQYLIAQQVPFDFIDDKLRFLRGVGPKEFYTEDNDFIRSGAST
jgi:hypothetical protein